MAAQEEQGVGLLMPVRVVVAAETATQVAVADIFHFPIPAEMEERDMFALFGQAHPALLVHTHQQIQVICNGTLHSN
jgi:hypothetical protein